MVRRLLLIAALAALAAGAQVPARLGRIASHALEQMQAPSASVAIVEHDQIIFARAYGLARLQPPTSAAADMRYSVGSISKQFTAAAILMLEQQGKLHLDDPVGRYLPGLRDGDTVTIREILSHTSGYSDYWPQDYNMPWILQPTTPQAIADHWARQPLDFPPGTQWQYSNTNYTLAGMIVQKITGQTPFQFLQQHVFQPLGMHSVVNTDVLGMKGNDALGYMRYGIGPPHPAVSTGRGWMFGAGELAMTASDLARWDISILRQSLLAPASYRELETAVTLKSGASSHYGLGLDVGMFDGHRELAHDGEVSGFTAQEMIFPDDQMAIVVLTNQDNNAAASSIAQQFARVLLEPAGDAPLEQARQILLGLQQGKLDRSLFTADANFYFNAQALADFKSSLAPLGEPLSFTPLATRHRGGYLFRGYLVQFPSRQIEITEYVQPDGKLEQYLIIPR